MGKGKDITGRRFGKLTAVAPTKERRYGRVVWRCKCDCGGEKFVDVSSLIFGLVQSCGCLQDYDLTRQKFGRLTAIVAVKKRKRGHIVWRCGCDCGKEKLVIAGSLRAGSIVSCGCYNKELISKDIRGKRFGKLVAISPTDERRHGCVIWDCLCDCGKKRSETTRELIGGRTKSCGCLTTAIDIQCERFGRLIAIRPTKQKDGHNVIWEMKCDCGESTLVSTSNLRNGHTKSCGCLQMASRMTRNSNLTPEDILEYPVVVKVQMEVAKNKKLMKAIKKSESSA